MDSVGLFGGTFDPVHNGHFELAKCAMQMCNLSEVIFIPTVTPPHKSSIKVSSFKDRVEMLKLAIESEKGFSISMVEKDLNPPNFTIDTLIKFFATSNKKAEYFFIIGVDAFLEIHSWKDTEKVLGSTHFIVSSRQGYSEERLKDLIKTLNYCRNDSNWYNEDTGKKIFYLDILTADISSSIIREKIRDNCLAEDVVNTNVMRYIFRNKLYSD